MINVISIWKKFQLKERRLWKRKIDPAKNYLTY